ncbi:MAG: hypothetical protein R2865_06865 [Deinococcales bacterium]
MLYHLGQRKIQRGSPSLKRLISRAAFWLGLLSLGYGMALSCAEVDVEGTQLELTGFGKAYFGSFHFNSEADEAELYDGVCLLADGEAWQLEASSLKVSNLSSEASFQATQVKLIWSTWAILASDLQSLENRFLLSQALITSSQADYQVEADSVLYQLDSSAISLENAVALSSKFRISGSKASIQNDKVYFEDAIATTCVCGDELYVIKAPEISYESFEENIIIQNGQLLLAGTTEIALAEELRLGSTSDNFRISLKVQYFADNEEAGTTGTGLEISLLDFTLYKNIKIDLGVIGLDEAHETNF